LDIVFNETVHVPFEHWAIDVQSEFLDDVLVDSFGVGRAAHAFDTKKFEVAFLQVMEAVTGEHMVNGDDRGRHC
jgi:hypothetical protein